MQWFHHFKSTEYIIFRSTLQVTANNNRTHIPECLFHKIHTRLWNHLHHFGVKTNKHCRTTIQYNTEHASLFIIYRLVASVAMHRFMRNIMYIAYVYNVFGWHFWKGGIHTRWAWKCLKPMIVAQKMFWLRQTVSETNFGRTGTNFIMRARWLACVTQVLH